MNFKRSLSPCVALGAAVALAGGDVEAQNRDLGAGGEVLDSVVALVDEGVVLRSELEERMQQVIQNFRQQQQQGQAGQQGELPPRSVLEDQVLEQLILEEIQLQRAERIGIEVGDDMLNQALSSVADNLGIPLDELPAALEEQGMDYAMYRERSREDLRMNQLVQRDVISSINVTPREMEQCLAERAATQGERLDYNVSHILVGMPSSASPDEVSRARDEARDVLERVESGEDFAQLALTHSDAQTALEGGSLGWRQGSELPTMFADTVLGMEPGEVSDPIRTGSGFHLVKLNERRGAEATMVEQLRARHILLRPNEVLDEDATRQKLEGIRRQIVEGEADFETLAVSQSEDQVSAAEGGDLGWVTPDEFAPEFADTLRELDVGTLSEPFQTRYGWHIAEITDTREHDMTEERQREECRQQIRSSKAQEEREIWLQRLRDQAYVDKRT